MKHSQKSAFLLSRLSGVLWQKATRRIAASRYFGIFLWGTLLGVLPAFGFGVFQAPCLFYCIFHLLWQAVFYSVAQIFLEENHMKKFLLAACAIVALTTATQAEDAAPQKISSFDFLINYEELKNPVEITDCQAYGVSVDFFMCSVRSKSGHIGAIRVGTDDLPKKQLVYGLQDCASITGDNEKACKALVTGLPYKTSMGQAGIQASAVKWLSEK
ncbi:hypothetical protein [Candidatus Tokpelaia sp.]|uniref:hypothetical protein n=1 Tax=Candidatus Tokpelaia sp. TaxID=2233777 RepID=UPI00123B6687|nr:hypothetical protein [Candidatus Tokpelaia sp.]KAA6404492.1 hypothetical protein DPQ22_09680 [Candidatus Tokpelaia sp.]